MGQALAAEPTVPPAAEKPELTLFDILEEFPPPREIQPRIPTDSVDHCVSRPLNPLFGVAFDARAQLIGTLGGRPVECDAPRYDESHEFGNVPAAGFKVEADSAELRVAFMQKSELSLASNHHCRWSINRETDSPTAEVLVVCYPKGIKKEDSPRGSLRPWDDPFVAQSSGLEH